MERTWQGIKARRLIIHAWEHFAGVCWFGVGSRKGCAVCTRVCLDEIEGQEPTSASFALFI